MPLKPEVIHQIEQNMVWINQQEAQVCTAAGNTTTGSPLTTDGKIWTIVPGNHMPIATHNSYAANDMVGHWVLVAEHRKTGERHVRDVLFDKNLEKGGRDFAAHAAAGPVQSPDTDFPKNNYTATTAPTVTDDSDSRYSANSLWVNLSTDLAYICVDAAVGAAVWQKLGSLTSFTLAGDSGSSAITDGNTLTVAGATGLDTSVSGDTVTVTPDFAEFASDDSFATTDEFVYLTGSTHKRGTLAGLLTALGQSSATVNTTDATVTTLQTIATASDISYTVETMVVARRTGGAAGAAGDSAGYKLFATFKNVAGTLTQVGATDKVAQEDQAGWDADFDVNTTNIRVRVTGAVDNNVTWNSYTTVRSV